MVLESEHFKCISLYKPMYNEVPPSGGHFSADFIFTRKLYKPCLKDAAYEIPLHLDYWFTRRRILHVFPYI